MRESAGAVHTQWLWRGYLAPESVTLLTSLWKSGKSTLIAVLLAQMKAVGKLAGLALQAGRAVVISEEPASLWAQRNRALHFGPHLSWYCQPFLGRPRMEDWQLLLDQIGRMHEQQAIDLLLIDSLAKLAPLRRENDAGEMLKALEPETVVIYGVATDFCDRYTVEGLLRHLPTAQAIFQVSRQPGQAHRTHRQAGDSQVRHDVDRHARILATQRILHCTDSLGHKRDEGDAEAGCVSARFTLHSDRTPCAARHNPAAAVSSCGRR